MTIQTDTIPAVVIDGREYTEEDLYLFSWHSNLLHPNGGYHTYALRRSGLPAQTLTAWRKEYPGLFLPCGHLPRWNCKCA